MTRLLTSLLRFFRQLSPPANQPLISPEQMREVFRQMLCDQGIRLSLKSIMGEAEPACVSANDPPASEVAGGDVDGKFGTVAGGPRNYTFSADAATRVPLTVQGFAGQSAPLQNWKNSAGEVLATMQASGKVGIGTTEPDVTLDVSTSDHSAYSATADLSSPTASVAARLVNSDDAADFAALQLGCRTTGRSLWQLANVRQSPDIDRIGDLVVAARNGVSSSSEIMRMSPKVAPVNAAGTVSTSPALSGTVKTTANSKAVTGYGTSFSSLQVDVDQINVNGEIKTVDTITDDTHLTVKSNFVQTNDPAVPWAKLSPYVTGSGTSFTTELSVGDRILIGTENRKVIEIISDTSLKADSRFTYTNSGATMTVYPPQNQGNVSTGQMNSIVFLSPLGGGQDDGVAITEAINALGGDGGIIMLTPGAYQIHTTIWITRNGVKVRGYGGNRETDPASVTLLQWVVDAGKPANQAVVRLGGVADYIQGIEISDLTVDGAGGGAPDSGQAEVGIELASVMNCVLRNVHVTNLRKSTNPSIAGGVGIRLTTYAISEDQLRNCDWNYFINCSAWSCARGVVLTNKDGGPPAGRSNTNPSHNIFIGLDISFYGDTASDCGLHLQVCDGNMFYRIWMQRQKQDDGKGWGVLLEHPRGYTASNYFFQLIPSIGKSWVDPADPDRVWGGSFLIRALENEPDLEPHGHKNFVFGYALGDMAEAPLAEKITNPGPPPITERIDPSKFLYWLDEESRSHGVAKLSTIGRPSFTPLTAPFTNPPHPYKVDASGTSVSQTTGSEEGQQSMDPARFLALIEPGDKVTIGGETRTVAVVTDEKHFTVEAAFDTSHADVQVDLYPFLMRLADSSDVAKLLVSDLGDMHASGSADFGSLKIGGTEVITDDRLLQNVLMSPSYPESISRPLVDILGDFPSVLNWGATGDGVTDDRAAFQNAIDNCAGNLLVPPGTYMLSDYLEVPSNITIIGIGQPCLKLMAYRPFRTNLTPPTEPNFNAVITNADRENGNHHIRLVGLKLDGNGDSQYQTDPGPPPNPARGANLAVVLLNYVSFFEIVDCELTGGVSECFYALGGSIDPYFGTTHGLVSNCHIHDSGQPDVDSLGVHGDRVDGMVVSGCTLQNIGLRAIGFSKGTNVSVCGCTVTNAQGAVQLGGTLHASISGVSGKDIRNDGITIALAPDSTAPLNITVAACSFQAKAANAGYGVRIAGGNFVSVGSVAVTGFAHDGFRVESGYNSLSNVVASNCAGFGIRLTGGEATGCTVGSYRAFSCALGSESEDGGAAGNEWHSPRMIAEALALNINGEPCIGSSRDIDAHSMKVGTLTAGKPVFAGSDLVLASQDLDLLAAYIINQLPIARGGTGADNAAGARWMLEVYGKSEVYTKAEVDALLANYVPLATYNAHGHWFGVPGHAHGGVTVGSGTSGEAGAYGNKTGGPY